MTEQAERIGHPSVISATTTIFNRIKKRSVAKKDQCQTHSDNIQMLISVFDGISSGAQDRARRSILNVYAQIEDLTIKRNALTLMTKGGFSGLPAS